MCRKPSLKLVICWLLCLVVPLWAQNIMIKPYSGRNFLLLKNNLFQTHYTKLENNAVEPSQGQIQFYYGISDYYSYGINYNKLSVNHEIFSAFYNKPKVDEKKMLRQAWEDAFGVDVWYPYYKAKEIETHIKKKLSVRIFKFKGEPKFEKNKVVYMFKTTF